jgi:hypothetical protein
MVSLFRDLMVVSSVNQPEVHVTHVSIEPRSGKTELADMGMLPVLGLGGRQQGSGPKGALVHLKCPRPTRPQKGHPTGALKEGDALALRFVNRDPFDGRDVHYRWMCRVLRRGIETLTLKPKGMIQKQTGLPVLVSDFSVQGAGLLNSPLLETYLMGDAVIPEAPMDLQEALTGRRLLLHFHPRLHFPKDLQIYCPEVPAAFSVLGEIVRASLDDGKDGGRIRQLGVAFRYEVDDVDPESLAVTAWKPLREMREHRHFKEIHRALSSLLAYLDR